MKTYNEMIFWAAKQYQRITGLYDNLTTYRVIAAYAAMISETYQAEYTTALDQIIEATEMLDQADQNEEEIVC